MNDLAQLDMIFDDLVKKKWDDMKMITLRERAHDVND